MNKNPLLNRRRFLSRTAGLSAASGHVQGQRGRQRDWPDQVRRGPGFHWLGGQRVARAAARDAGEGKTLSDLGMKMGVFVAYASFDEPVFATVNAAKHDEVLKKIRDAVDIAKFLAYRCR